MIRTTVFALLAFGVASGAAAQASAPAAAHHGGATGPAAVFRSWDADRDGVLSLAEFQAGGHPGAEGEAVRPDPRHTPEHFRELDGNGDGRVSLAEFEAHHRAPHEGH